MTYIGPREKIWEKGTRTLTDAELLAVVIGSGPRRANQSVLPSCLQLAEEILQQYPSLGDFFDASLEEMLCIRGLGRTTAARLSAIREIGFRLKSGAGKIDAKISCPADVPQYFDWLQREEQEVMCALFLTTTNKMIRIQEIFRGGVSKCLGEPREIFKAALRANACQMVLVHNHPSGDFEPSDEDRRVTALMQETGGWFGIRFLDHIIISKNGYFSFAEEANSNFSTDLASF